jgi:hypothetical protein
MLGPKFLVGLGCIFVGALYWGNCVVADEQSALPSGDLNQENFLEYRLRPGESLSHVADLFRIPIKELMRVNNIVDSSRVVAGRILKVPNIFARQVARLQEERIRLLAEMQQIMMEKEKLQDDLAVRTREGHKEKDLADSVFKKLMEEVVALNAQLRAVQHWQKIAQFLGFITMGLLGWIFMLRRAHARFVGARTILY